MRSDLIVDGKYGYSLDRSESGLSLWISPTSLDVWELEVVALPTQDYEGDENAPLSPPSLRIAFSLPKVNSWGDIAGLRKEIRYEVDESQPMLPDESAMAYLGYHLRPNNHVIRIGPCAEGAFPVSWTCDARSNPTKTFDLNTLVPFTGVGLSYGHLWETARERSQLSGKNGKRPDDICEVLESLLPEESEVRSSLATRFDPTDFGAPKRGRWTFLFPINTR